MIDKEATIAPEELFWELVEPMLLGDPAVHDPP
jgi:hypothetical protein